MVVGSSTLLRPGRARAICQPPGQLFRDLQRDRGRAAKAKDHGVEPSASLLADRDIRPRDEERWMAEPENDESREADPESICAEGQAVAIVCSPPHPSALEPQPLPLELAGVSVDGGQASPAPDPGNEDPHHDPYAQAGQNEPLKVWCVHAARSSRQTRAEGVPHPPAVREYQGGAELSGQPGSRPWQSQVDARFPS